MKKIIIIALTIVCGVAFSESFAKKPKKSAEMQKEEKCLQEEKELMELQHQMFLDSIEIVKKKRQLELEKLKQEFNKAEVEEMGLPCIEEARSTDEYYGAWAVSDGKPNQSIAVQEAMRRAQLELAIQIGEKEVVLDDVEIVCRTISRDTRGNFIAYVAIRKPKNK
jgi:hypothetical protein